MSLVYSWTRSKKEEHFFLFGFGVLAVSRQASEYDINSTVPINYSYFSERQASTYEMAFTRIAKLS